MRLIDADALIEKWYEVNNIGPEDRGAIFIGYTEIPRFINNAPTVQPTGDLISRADAIEAVHEYYQKRFTEDSKWDADAKMFVLEDKTIAKDNMEICNIINTLPSAEAVSIHEDGTLEVKVPNAHKVGRVLVKDADSHIGGGLFYPDREDGE